MKLLHILLFPMLFIVGCATQEQAVYLDRLYITRKYIGDFRSMEVVETGVLFKKTMTVIRTDRHEFYIHGDPRLEINPGARCYAKYFPEKIPNSVSSISVLYFTWNGTEDMFEIWQDPFTGYIYQ